MIKTHSNSHIFEPNTTINALVVSDICSPHPIAIPNCRFDMYGKNPNCPMRIELYTWKKSPSVGL